MKRQDSQHRQDGQEQRNHAAHHAGARMNTAVLPEKVENLPIDGRALFHFTLMAIHGEASVSLGTEHPVKKREHARQNDSFAAAFARGQSGIRDGGPQG
ncbi:hypothetical protein D3C85_904250 [compost metagenome]